MAKREATLDEGSPHAKRQKLTEEDAAAAKNTKISFACDIKDLLLVAKAADTEAKQKVNTFKGFLSGIKSNAHSEEGARRQRVLLEFFQSQQSSTELSDVSAFSCLVQSWHFAVQANSEAMCSSIAAVLALLLKVISNLIEFLEYGVSLCHELLKNENLPLFNRGLSANRNKEYMIDPCLRLLTEITRFDGGSAAKAVFRQRETTFHRLDLFLSMQRDQDCIDRDSRRPPIRESAQQFVLANLRLQGLAAKSYLLGHSRITRAFLQDVGQDPPWMVHEILGVLRKDVLEDSTLSRSARDRFLNEATLRHLAGLYNYREPLSTCSSLPVKQAVHAFLIFACLSPDRGSEKAAFSGSTVAFGFHGGMKENRGKSLYDDFHDGVSRSTKNIAALLGYLRPYADILQGEFVLKVFQAYPLLIHSYYSGKSAFSFAPNLTATWIGYSRLILATIQLPILGKLWQEHSNDNIVSQHLSTSVLPQILDKKVLTRCLNSSHDLIAFLTARILNAALEKLQHVMRQLDDETQGLASERLRMKLTMELAARCPDMQHVVARLRSCPTGNVTMKESITRLLAAYHKVIPDIALGQAFDISAELSDTLDAIDEPNERECGDSMRNLVLDHVLHVAVNSPSMHWWHRRGSSELRSKLKGAELSPFTRLMMTLTRQPRIKESSYIKRALSIVAQNNGIVRSTSKTNALDVLLLSLRRTEGEDQQEIYEYLDQCIIRIAQKAVMYLEQTYSTDAMPLRIDLLLFALAKQWPYIVQSKSIAIVNKVAFWLSTYLRLAAQEEGSSVLITMIGKDIAALSTVGECREQFERSLEQPLDLALEKELQVMRKVLPNLQSEQAQDTTLRKNEDTLVTDIDLSPPKEETDHPDIHRWICEELHDAALDGLLGKVVLCLCSCDAAIRRESLGDIRKLMGKLEASSYTERQQIYLLLGEVVETAVDAGTVESLPYVAGTLTAKLLLVFADPLHFLYVKASEFLHKGPRWNVAKLPSYWVNKIILSEPTIDEGYFAEVEWLLEYLVDGLRTPMDMEIYRRSNILERILSMSWSPSIPATCFNKVVDLLLRCTYVEGSTTLITRCGIISWISAGVHRADSRARLKLAHLAQRLSGTTDRRRINEWSDNGIGRTIEDLTTFREDGWACS